MRTSSVPRKKALKVIKNIVLAAALATASIVSSGCVSSDSAQASNESINDREYPTGSSIPKKTKNARPNGDVYDRDALERAQQDRTQGVTPSSGARAGGGM